MSVCQIKFIKITIQDTTTYIAYVSMIDGGKTISSMTAPFEAVTWEVCDYIQMFIYSLAKHARPRRYHCQILDVEGVLGEQEELNTEDSNLLCCMANLPICTLQEPHSNMNFATRFLQHAICNMHFTTRILQHIFYICHIAFVRLHLNLSICLH